MSNLYTEAVEKEVQDTSCRGSGGLGSSSGLTG